MPDITLRFPFGDIVVAAKEGETVFEALRRENLPIRGDCNGKGSCGKCFVRVLKGDQAEPGEAEREKLGKFFHSGLRLACLWRPVDDIFIELPLEREKAKILTEDNGLAFQSDGEDGLAIAFDIGTTTIAGFLIDLKNGEKIAKASALNEQKIYGADVITRSNYTLENPNGLETLQKIILKQIGELSLQMLRESCENSEDVIRLALCGNPTMIQICAGMSLEKLAVLPYTPSYYGGFSKPAWECGIEFLPAGTEICFMPLISGYVGADCVAASLACGQDENEMLTLLVDIGTNGEMLLGNREKMFSCATAAGPAFEGGNISQGSGAVEGAVEKVYDDNGPKCTTIANHAAKSICGSGLIDAAALLVKKGCINASGLLSDEYCYDENYDERFDHEGNFVLANKSEGTEFDILLSPKDIRELQLAKSAIASGIESLLARAGVEAEAVEKLYLAGGFGNYIDQKNACFIGLIPEAFQEKIVVVGNAAGLGCCAYAASAKTRKRAEELRKKVENIDLSHDQGFSERFMENMAFDKAID